MEARAKKKCEGSLTNASVWKAGDRQEDPRTSSSISIACHLMKGCTRRRFEEGNKGKHGLIVVSKGKPPIGLSEE